MTLPMESRVVLAIDAVVLLQDEHMKNGVGLLNEIELDDIVRSWSTDDIDFELLKVLVWDYMHDPVNQV